MKFIFLDIDGVLNCSEYFNSLENGYCYNEIDESRVILLKEIVDTTGAKIVLCSTWRELVDMGEMGEPHSMYIYLVEELGKHGLEIYSHTPIIDFNRPYEIWDWIMSQKDIPEGYVILDDDFSKEHYEHYGMGRHLVKTSFYGNGGLQKEDADKAIKILEGY